jgi:opacity protein-like surface antigen
LSHSASFHSREYIALSNAGTKQVAPYASIGIDDNVSLDVVGGYSRIDYDLDRLDPLSSTKVTGGTESDRFFGSINLVVDYDVSNILLGFRMGTSYISEEQDAYSESDGTAEGAQKVTVGSGNVGLRVGFDGGAVQPYVGGTYSYDYDDSGGTYDGRNTFGVSAGLNITITDGVFFNLEGGGTMNDDVKTASSSGTMRFGINF